MSTSNPPTPLILASSSPRRSDLLKSAGIPFVIHVSRVREKTRLLGRSARQLAMHNAELKAEEVARRFPGRRVLGADTVVVLGKRLFGKPKNMKEAGKMLAQLVGRIHRVITGVCLCREGQKNKIFAVTSRVTFKKLTREKIGEYLKLIHPLDKAGAYAAQEHTDRIIARVEGSFSNVVGLPMERVMKELGITRSGPRRRNERR